MTKISNRVIVFCLMLLCLICPASAYTTQYYWSNGYVGYTIDSSVPTAYKSCVDAAANAWTNAGADFDYYSSVNSNNKVRYYSFGSQVNYLGSCTRYVYSGTTRLSKMYIDLNSDYSSSWSTSTPCPSGKYDVLSVFTHEFGHGVGLGHSTITSATMFKDTNSGTVYKRSLEQDDKNGIIAIYGT
ncbi:MAG: matrixin family metalloprotease [Methanomethylovorans sp.]|nr:matrixin family metalloprotease [Methanomethylovorans sp.]